MGNSRKWVTIFWVLMAAVIALFVNAALHQAYIKNYQDNYLAAVIDKEQLLKNTPSPKIIIIGGSNAAFGFDSRLMKEELGMNVVNMGIQGGIGIRFPINMVKRYLNEGDIVLLSPEYHNILGGLQGGRILAQVLVLHPGGVRYLSSVDEVVEVLKALPNVHTDAVKNYIEFLTRDECKFCYQYDEVYHRGAFDPTSGDIRVNTYIPEREIQLDLSMYHVPSLELSDNIRYFNAFNDLVRSRNAKMFFVMPSIVENYDSTTGQILVETEKILNRDLDFPILGSLESSTFPKELMFDTAYHMNDEGRKLRTIALIGQLIER